MRFLARPRADSRCIHAGARSPSPGTPPGIAFRRAAFARIALPSGAFRTPALRLLLLPCAALRSLVFALVPLRPLGFPLPAVRLLARFPSVAVRLRALRTGALRFSALRAGLHSPPPGPAPVRGVGLPLSSSRLVALRSPLFRAVAFGSVARGPLPAFRLSFLRFSRFRLSLFRCGGLRLLARGRAVGLRFAGFVLVSD